jgi:dipeptidyl aminopeptidase/acylaminoacyl peptidase
MVTAMAAASSSKPTMLRRTFLLGAAAALTARPQKRSGLGSLAYIQEGTLWIRRLPDGEPRALAAGNSIYAPKFSASGNWITFREGDDLLRLVSADGKRAKSWVGTGQWLTGADELAVYFGEARNQTLIFSESDGWNLPLRAFADPLGTISLDGRLRAWESSAGDGKQLYLAPLAEPGEPRLIAETKEGGFQVFGFARGGSRFLYWMTDEDGADCWSYGMDFYMAGGAEPVKTGVSTLVSDMMSLSPVADMLAAGTGNDHLSDQDHGIALVDISADSEMPVRPITGPLVSAINPAWSPDGGQLAWAQGRRIWTAGDRGLGQQKQLTNDARYYDEMPVWSRDGSQILFGRWDRQDARTLWLMRADGSDAREVAGPFSSGSNFPDDWSDLSDWSRKQI